MKTRTAIGLAIGVGLFVAILYFHQPGEILRAVAAAGWGLLLVSGYRFLPLATDAQGWRMLFAAERRPPFPPLWRIRWIGEAVNSLLPVAQVGGDVVRARLAARYAGGGATAGAAVVVDFTLGIVTQILHTLVGVGLLFYAGVFDGHGRIVLIVTLAAVVGVAVLILGQHLKLFSRLVRAIERRWSSPRWMALVGGAEELDRRIPEVYARPHGLAAALTWRVLTRAAHVGETWLMLRVLGIEAGLLEALVLDSISTGVRSAAFAIPGALGAQEGSFLLVGAVVGLPAEASLALALVKRARELLVGVPGLLAWAAAEHKSLRSLITGGP